MVVQKAKGYKKKTTFELLQQKYSLLKSIQDKKKGLQYLGAYKKVHLHLTQAVHLRKKNLKHYIQDLKKVENKKAKTLVWVKTRVNRKFKTNLGFELKANTNTKERKKNKKKDKPKICIVYFRRTKRNICLTLCNHHNFVKANLSIGYLQDKNNRKLKVRARKAVYNLKKLGSKLVTLIYKKRFNQIKLKFKNEFPKKVKKIFFNVFKQNKNSKVVALSFSNTRPHNGCRRPKIRRK